MPQRKATRGPEGACLHVQGRVSIAGVDLGAAPDSGVDFVLPSRMELEHVTPLVRRATGFALAQHLPECVDGWGREECCTMLPTPPPLTRASSWNFLCIPREDGCA